MRIAMVSLQFGKTVTGGGGHHVEKITQGLSSMGHEVTVLSIHTANTQTDNIRKLGDGPALFSTDYENHVPVVRLLVEEGIEHPYVGTKAIEFARIRKFCDAVALWMQAHDDEFDVVHLHGHHMTVGYLARQLKTAAKSLRVVSTVHAVESVYEAAKLATGHSDEDDEHIKRCRMLEAEYRFADAIVAPSPAVKSEILQVMAEASVPREAVEDKLHVVTSGIDEGALMPIAAIRTKLAEAPSSSKTLNVLLLSRIDPSKGLQFAIRALAELAGRTMSHELPVVKPQGGCGGVSPQTVTINLSIAGRVSSDKYLAGLKAEARKLGDVLDIEFHIDVSEQRKLELLDDAQLYILPTLQDTFGITIVEAGARGDIIVTTDTDGPMYVITSPDITEYHWGYVTEYGIAAKKTADASRNLADNIAAALEWVLLHWADCTKRVIAFQSKIKREFMWDTITDAYIELYKEPA